MISYVLVVVRLSMAVTLFLQIAPLIRLVIVILQSLEADGSVQKFEKLLLADHILKTGAGPAETVVMVLSSVFNDTNTGKEISHPAHIHGHSFYILLIGHGDLVPGSDPKQVMNSRDLN
jgi:hypothetical protein